MSNWVIGEKYQLKKGFSLYQKVSRETTRKNIKYDFM